ncbi:MAG: endolytic transglycosylase MltG [bacterium]
MKKIMRYLVGLVIITFIIILSIVVYLILGLKPVSDEKDIVGFTVTEGTGKVQIIENLYEAGIIKNSLSLKVYLYLDYSADLMAGYYELDRSMSAVDIIGEIQQGNSINDTASVTFIEGKRVTEYARVIANNFGYEYDEVIEVINDTEFLNYLIDKYEILTDEILGEDIYYALEGYLFPDTYSFYKDASIETIIEKMVENTNKKLLEHIPAIEATGHTMHEIITLASISELEANSKEDREDVAQVVYTRLEINMTLGMDVTSYYGAQLDMSEEITYDNGLADENGYNTRISTFFGLPVGAICNPSLESIEAAIYPGENDYVYFIACEETGVVYFFTTYADFLDFKHS